MEASVGDGFTGDIAIDDLSFMDCTLYPGKKEYFNIWLISNLFTEKPTKEINISFQQIFQNALNCVFSNILTLEEIIVNLC